jgi:hypothetical protein
MFQSPTPLKQLAPSAPEGVDVNLNQALEKDPRRRYGAAREMKQTISVCRTLFQPGGIKTAVVDTQVDPAKTVVIKRKAGQPLASDAPAFKRVAIPLPAVQQKFCPHCTSPNKLDATVCATCAMPLGDGMTLVKPEPKRTNWTLVIAVAVIALLGAIAALVLTTER